MRHTHWLDDRRAAPMGAPPPLKFDWGAPVQETRIPAASPGGMLRNVLPNKSVTTKQLTSEQAITDFRQGLINLQMIMEYKAGFTASAQRFALILCVYESGKLSATGYLKDNNPGNIMYFGKDPAKRGHFIKANGTYLEHFTDLVEFVLALKRELQKNKGAGAPIDAENLEDFVHRLKVNGYYTEPEDRYLNGCYAAEKILIRMGIIRDVSNWQKSKEDKLPKSLEPPKPFSMPWWGWALVGVGAFGILKSAAK